MLLCYSDEMCVPEFYTNRQTIATHAAHVEFCVHVLCTSGIYRLARCMLRRIFDIIFCFLLYVSLLLLHFVWLCIVAPGALVKCKIIECHWLRSCVRCESFWLPPPPPQSLLPLHNHITMFCVCNV